MKLMNKRKSRDVRTRLSQLPKGRKYTYVTVVSSLLILFLVNLFIFSDVLALGDAYEANRKFKVLRIEAPHGNVEFVRSQNEKIKVELIQTNAEARRIKVKAAGDKVVVIERFGVFGAMGNRPSATPSRYKIKVWLPSYMQRVEIEAKNVSGKGVVAKKIDLSAGKIDLAKIESDRLHVNATDSVKLAEVRTVTGEIFSHQRIILDDTVTNERLTVETEAGEIQFKPRAQAGQVTVETEGKVDASDRYTPLADGQYQLSTSNRPTVQITSETGAVMLR